MKAEKIVGLLNIFFGIVELIIQIELLLTYSRLFLMYKKVEAELPFMTMISPIISVLVICLMLFVISVGLKLVKAKVEDTKLFKKGVTWLIVTIAIVFLLTGFSVLSVITPIYNLTKAL